MQELANRMAERGGEVVKALFKMGVMATITQTIDADTAELVVEEFGHKAKRVSADDIEIGLRADDGGHAAGEQQRRLASFERGQLALDHSLAGVAVAAVFLARQFLLNELDHRR